jgi:hypothetical protein
MKNITYTLLFILIFLAKSLRVDAQLPSYVPKSGLVAWWPFNGNANDVSGSGFHGTINGASITSDRFGIDNSAYSFDGINDFISTKYQGILGDSARSISFWVLHNDPNSTPWNNIVLGSGSNICGSSSIAKGFYCGVGSQGIGIDCNESGVIYKPNQQVNNGKWHHFVFVKSISSTSPRLIKVYQDGNLLTEIIDSYNPSSYINTALGTSFTIGLRTFTCSPNRYFKGNIDDIGIWKRELSFEEISNLFNACSGKIYNPMKDSVLFCGSSVALDAGAGFKNYMWNIGANKREVSVSNTRSYKVTVLDSIGCYYSDSTFLSIINTSSLESQYNICEGDQVELSAQNISTTFKIGDRGPANGIIFYDKGNNADGWQYMEVTAADNGSSGGIGCYCTSLNPYYEGVGYGMHSSYVWSINNCDGWARSSLNYSQNGYRDWFLPTKDELNLLYINLKLKNIGNFKDDWYWSSTPAPYGSCGIDGGVLTQYFVTGQQSADYRSGYQGAGPVRYVRNVSKPLSQRFIWSTGDTASKIIVNPIITTSYTVEMTNGISTCRDTAIVKVVDPISFNPFVSSNIYATQDSVILNSNTGFNRYRWNTGDSTVSIVIKKTGSYKVTVTNASGCTASDSVFV